MSRLRAILRAFRDDARGAAAVEFALVAPMYLGLVFATFEAGWLMTKSMMLDRALDLTIRDLKLGVSISLSQSEFEAAICRHASIIRDCESSMILQLKPIKTVADIPNENICKESTSPVRPTPVFDPGGANDLMYIKACVRVKPLFPGLVLALHLPKDEGGQAALVAYSSFVNQNEAYIARE